jgi:hypothetical protein
LPPAAASAAAAVKKWNRAYLKNLQIFFASKNKLINF